MVFANFWSLEFESTVQKTHELNMEDEVVGTEESTYCLLEKEKMNVEQQN